MNTDNQKNEEETEPGQVPAGTGCAGRSHARAIPGRRVSVEGKKGRRGPVPCRKGSRKGKLRKPAGRNVTASVTEAVRILKEMGYFAGIIDDPSLPFHLIAFREGGIILIRVARPRKAIMNAAGVRDYLSKDVLEMQPFWHSDRDNIQFWVFSRVAGLIRYRVFRCGIWNVETMQEGWQERRAGTAGAGTGKEEGAVQQSRTAPLPVRATGRG